MPTPMTSSTIAILIATITDVTRDELDPEDEHGGHQQDDDDRRDVEGGLLAGDRRRQRDAEVVEQLVQVARPADRDRGGAERELQDQVPADDPGDELAERRVGERVGRARDRHGRGELGVAEAARPQTTPAITNEIATAGPAWSRATTPVSTKMPVPMITPTPKTVRSRPERCFLSRCSGSSVSRMESSTDLMRRVPWATASSSVPAPAGSSSFPQRRTGAGTPHAYAAPAQEHPGRSRRCADERNDTPRTCPRSPWVARRPGRPAAPAAGRRPRSRGRGARARTSSSTAPSTSTASGTRRSPGGRARGHRGRGRLRVAGALRADRGRAHRDRERYGLHPLAVEDAVYAHQRPKLEHYDDALFMVLKTATLRGARAADRDQRGRRHRRGHGLPRRQLRDHRAARRARRPDRPARPAGGAARPAVLGPSAVLYAVADLVVDTFVEVAARSRRTSTSSRRRSSAPSAPTTSAGSTSSSGS